MLLAYPRTAMIALHALNAPTPELRTTVDARSPVPIVVSAAYYSPYLVQPGVRVDLDFSWAQRSKPRKRSRKPAIVTRHLFAGPRLATYFRPKNRTTFAAEFSLGYRASSDARGWYWAPSASLGYALGLQVQSHTLALGDGRISSTIGLRHELQLTARIDLGRRITERIAGFVGISYGRSLWLRPGNATFYALSIGLRFVARGPQSKTP